MKLTSSEKYQFSKTELFYKKKYKEKKKNEEIYGQGLLIRHRDC